MLTFLLSAVSPRSHYITPMSRRGAEFGIQSAISGLRWPGCSLCSRVMGIRSDRDTLRRQFPKSLVFLSQNRKVYAGS